MIMEFTRNIDDANKYGNSVFQVCRNEPNKGPMTNPQLLLRESMIERH